MADIDKPVPLAMVSKAQVAEQLKTLLDWDLPDDPHGYSCDYDKAVKAIAESLGINLD